jgi:hypothetical protein
MPPRRPLLVWPVQQATLVFGWQLPEDPGACSMAGMAETATALARMAKMVENCILIELVVWWEVKLGDGVEGEIVGRSGWLLMEMKMEMELIDDVDAD